MTQIVTIDGPAGSGKSTAAAALAQKLNWQYYNTGLVYRAAGIYASQYARSDTDYNELLEVISTIKLLDIDDDVVFVIGELNHCYSIENELRTPHASHMASYIGGNNSVGQELVRLMHNSKPDEDFVVEGRNTGSYVFTKAQVKFYLDASIEVRKQRISTNSGTQNAEIVIERDNRDSERNFAPLCVPESAFRIDSTSKTLNEVVDNMHKIVAQNIPL